MSDPPATSVAPSGSASSPADDPVTWYAGLLEPLAALALRQGVSLPVLLDSLKLALVRAAVDVHAASAQPGAPGRALSDSRVSVMTGVHRKDLRRLRQAGPSALGHSHSVASEVFTCWLADARWHAPDGRPRDLPRQPERPDADSFESLVASVTRDVHPRAVLDELQRLQLVELFDGPDGTAQVRVSKPAFVPHGDRTMAAALARDNLADHVAAIAGNLDDQGQTMGEQFLEQAIYSDELTAASAQRFNRETREAWEQLFAHMMPRLKALHEADRQAAAPRDHRVRLGAYGYATRIRPDTDDPYQ